ncbi:hypothetical protein K501DRAFT_334278 [Backusella circina FSU 941]|nr:hypothetical protein K501DRAFT_334278 [Backusella circina FSU 941]
MKSSSASKIISGILLTPAILILLSLLIILPSTALAQLESFIVSIQNPSTLSFWSLDDLTVRWFYSPWFSITLLFCIYKVTPTYNLFLKQATYEIRQRWLSFNTKNDILYTSKETMPCTYYKEVIKSSLHHQPHKQVNRKKQPQLHPVNNKKEGEDEQAMKRAEIKAPTTAALPSTSITKIDHNQESTVNPIEWTIVAEKSSKKKKKTKPKRNSMQNTRAASNNSNNNNNHTKDKSSKIVRNILPDTTTGTTTCNSIPKKMTKNTTNNNNNNNIKPSSNTMTTSFAATAAAATSNKDSQTKMKSFQETLESVSNSGEDENQPDVPFLSDNESSGSESPCSTHNSLPSPLLQDEPSYYSPFSTGFDFGVCTVTPSPPLYNEEVEAWNNTTRHQHQWESGFLRPLYHTSQHKTSLLHLLNQSDKVETTITSESFRYFDDMVMSNTLYSSPPRQKSHVPRDWDSVLLIASHHHH